jgi:hypothetical protein
VGNWSRWSARSASARADRESLLFIRAAQEADPDPVVGETYGLQEIERYV